MRSAKRTEEIVAIWEEEVGEYERERDQACLMGYLLAIGIVLFALSLGWMVAR